MRATVLEPQRIRFPGSARIVRKPAEIGERNCRLRCSGGAGLHDTPAGFAQRKVLPVGGLNQTVEQWIIQRRPPLGIAWQTFDQMRVASFDPIIRQPRLADDSTQVRLSIRCAPNRSDRSQMRREVEHAMQRAMQVRSQACRSNSR